MNHIVDKTGSMSQALVMEISSGVYRANSKLPGERKLGEYFNVSRTTTRAVLEDFEKKGIIVRKSRTGAYVTENAIQIIERDFVEASLHIFFVMPPTQQTNPLIRSVFSTFLQYADKKIQASILFQNELYDDMLHINQNAVVVVFGLNDKKQLAVLNDQAAKLIILNNRDDQYDFISPDNYAGGKLMAEHLLESGHTKIVSPIFERQNTDTDFTRRYDGLKDTLKKSGATLNTFSISRGMESDPCEYNKALDYFLNQCEGMTALACMSDKTAMNIYANMNQLGISIPDKLSVIGFDDQYYAQYTCPPLTSVQYPAEALGIHLANGVNNYLVNGSTKIREVIEPILIKRESVKNIISRNVLY